jgi:glycosyltransferase involved in cell wall biosynthesis
MTPVTLSVVICTKDRPRDLAACLGSLAQQTRLPEELIVVDASERPDPGALERYRVATDGRCVVRHLTTAPGLPRQRNIGVRAARGTVVVFLDDDVVLFPPYLREIAAVYDADARGDVGGVGGALDPDPTPAEGAVKRAFRRAFLLEGYGTGRVKRSGHPEYLFAPTEPTAVEFLSGCNMSFRREVFDGLAFDERLDGYALGEDLQFSYRVSRRWRLVLTPRARCDHRQAAGGRPVGGARAEMAVFHRYLFFREHVARTWLDGVAWGWAALGGLLRALRHPRHGRLAGTLRGFARAVRHLVGSRDDETPATRLPPVVVPGGRAPLVSVVVPARNEEGFLGACLDSILAQTYPADRTEIVVVENGSTDGTRTIAEAYERYTRRVRVVVSDAVNQAAAMNDGVRAASGTIVARVDAHSTIAPDYLERVVAAFARHPGAVCVGGPFLPAGDTLLERVTGLARSSRLGVGGGYGCDRDLVDHVVRSVQCGAYRRDALVAVGLFDVTMAYGEDEEVNWRLRKQVGPIVLCPDLLQYYRPRPTLGALLRQYWNYGQGRLRVVRKHPDFLLPRHLVPALFVVALGVLGAAALASAAARFAVAGLVGTYAVVLAGAGLAVSAAGWREALLVPLAVALIHLGYGAGMLWAAAPLGLARPRGAGRP